jgi:DNA repair exonuclease SbcCD ATPase subunit
MATPKEIQKQLERIQKLYDQLGKSNPFAGADAEAISKSTQEVEKLGDALEGVENRVSNLDQTFSNLQTQLRNTVNEIKKGPDATSRLAKGFRGVLNEVKKLTYEEEGLDKLSIDQLKTLKKKASQRQSDASAAAKELTDQFRIEAKSLGTAKEKRAFYNKQTDAVKAALAFQRNEDETLQTINDKINKRIKFEEEVNKNLGLGGNIIKGVGGALEKIGMGGLAKQLGLDEAQEKMRQVAEEITESGGGLTEMQKKRKVLSAGFDSMKSSLVKNLTDPLSIGLFIFKQMADALTAVDKLSGELAKNLNISYSEAADLSSELSKAANQSGSMTITAAGLGEALMAANGELGIFNTTIDDNLILFQKLHKTAGLTYQELSGVKSITDATGGDLEKNTKELLAQSRLTGQKFGVALNEKEVMKDISNVSKATTLSLGMSTKELAKAVSTTKALGMEMSQVEGIADSLLNFESSIEKELEAELLLGKNINLEKARQAALNNDIAGVAEEIAKQAGSAAEFGKMNRIQQEALAGAVGMSREELAKSLFVQEQIGNLTGDEYEIRKKQIEELEGKGLSQKQIAAELGKQSIDDLKNQNSMQENLNKGVSKLKELFVSIAGPVMQIVSPIVDLLIPAIGGLGYAFELIGIPLRGVADVLSTIVGYITDSLPLMTALIAGATTYLYLKNQTLIKEQASAAVTLLKTGYEKASLIIGNAVNAIKTKGLVKSIADMAMTAFSSVAKIPFIGPVLGIAAAAGAAALGYQYLSKGDDVMSAGSNMSGYGSRTLMGPEGAIALNNKDTVIAGTNLFPKGNDVISGPAGSVQIPDNSEAKRTNALLSKLINRPDPVIEMNGDNLGTAVGKYAYSVQ